MLGIDSSRKICSIGHRNCEQISADLNEAVNSFMSFSEGLFSSRCA